MFNLFCVLSDFGYGVLRRTRKGLAVFIAVFALSSPIFAQTVVVAALGDSLTAGYGLPRDQGFVPQLNRALVAAGHDVEVLNAGVSGDTTAGGMRRVDWTLEDRVQGMIVTLGGNDLLRGLDPAQSKQNLAKIIEKAQAQKVPVLLAGMQVPLNFGPEYKAAFDAIYPALAAEYDTLFYPSFMAGLGYAGSLAAVAPYMQRDGIHPNAEGVALIVADILPSVIALEAQIRAK